MHERILHDDVLEARRLPVRRLLQRCVLSRKSSQGITMKTGSLTLRRIVPVALSAGLLLSAPPAAAFLSSFTLIGEGARSFTFQVGNPTQWTWDDLGGTGNIYRGVLDSARFNKGLGLSFSDTEGITSDGAAVRAKLKGKISSDCSSAKITLKDSTNGVTLTLEWPTGNPFTSFRCFGL
jgi:hypothetical protein